MDTITGLTYVGQEGRCVAGGAKWRERFPSYICLLTQSQVSVL